jgi:hypothetical protein
MLCALIAIVAIICSQMSMEKLPEYTEAMEIFANWDEDGSEPGVEISYRQHLPFPHSDRILKISSNGDERVIRKLASESGSEFANVESLKMDGFIIQLSTRDGLSLGTSLLGADLNLKWSATNLVVCLLSTLRNSSDSISC